MGISATLLAYKEEENLRVLLPKIREQLDSIGEDYEILVIDSAEPLDNTAEVCELNGARYINQEEPFFGGAFRTGIKYATKDKFLIMDSDCSHDPVAIPAIHKAFVSGADIVIGSRYVEGGVSNDSKVSYALSKIMNRMFHHALKTEIKDISTDYRMYHTDALKSIKLYGQNYDVLQEVILKLKVNKTDGDFVVKEVPIIFNKRAYGSSKRDLFKFIAHYCRTLLKLWFMRIMCDKGTRTVDACEKRAELLMNIVLYFIIGCCAAVIDYLVFLITNLIFNAPLICNVFGAIGGFIFAFFFNTYFNFESRNYLKTKFASYALVCLIGTFISTGMMYMLEPYMNIWWLKLLCTLVAAIVQFILNKTVTYGMINELMST